MNDNRVSSSEAKAARGVNLTTHLHLLSSLEMSGDIPMLNGMHRYISAAFFLEYHTRRANSSSLQINFLLACRHIAQKIASNTEVISVVNSLERDT